MKRVAAGAWLLAPAAVSAQDVTAVVALGVPPLLLACLLSLIVRAKYLMTDVGAMRRLAGLAAFGLAELALWLVIGGAVAMVYFAERWPVIAIAVLAVLGLASTARLVGAPHPSWRFTLGFLLVFPVTWLLLQLAWYLAALVLL